MTSATICPRRSSSFSQERELKLLTIGGGFLSYVALFEMEIIIFYHY